MKTLLLDIETRPNLAYVWGLWDQNVALNQLVEATEMICFAAKWLGEPKVQFWSTHHHTKEVMVAKAHDLLNEADAVMGWNSKSFDIKHLNREFLEAGLNPPSSFKQIDLMKTVKAQFRLPSNKLQYVSTLLGLQGKVAHEGFDLWVKCMAGDETAWRKMRTYNKRDVTLLEDLYNKLLPWIVGHPNVNLYADEDEDGRTRCTKCGSEQVVKEGKAYTDLSVFQQWSCKDCGAWFRSTRRDRGVSERSVAS